MGLGPGYVFCVWDGALFLQWAIR